MSRRIVWERRGHFVILANQDCEVDQLLLFRKGTDDETLCESYIAHIALPTHAPSQPVPVRSSPRSKHKSTQAEGAGVTELLGGGDIHPFGENKKLTVTLQYLV